MAVIEKEESARESKDVKAGFYPMGSDGYQMCECAGEHV